MAAFLEGEENRERIRLALCRAAIAGVHAIRAVEPDARMVHIDPLVLVLPPADRRTARSFDPRRGSARTWILTIVHRRAVDLVWRANRHRTSEHIEQSEAHGPTAEQTAELRGERELVQGALRRLPDRERQLIELAYYGGYTQSDLASSLGLSLGTVKSRTSTGRARMRRSATNLSRPKRLRRVRWLRSIVPGRPVVHRACPARAGGESRPRQAIWRQPAATTRSSSKATTTSPRRRSTGGTSSRATRTASARGKAS